MPTDANEDSVTDAVRARSASFVNDHARTWVAGEEGGVQALGADDATLV
ncbi:hypothetical protein [Streptacidiphilus anmyonensis]|nr:hypothetical protein [Streptacidiphilus anmyonensis]